jgi:hypothetical protein
MPIMLGILSNAKKKKIMIARDVGFGDLITLDGRTNFFHFS